METAAGSLGAGVEAHRRRALDGRQRRVATILVILAWLVFVFPAFTGKARFPVDFTGPPPGGVDRPLLNPELGDAFFAFHPWRSYMGDRLGNGDVPLWDPYRFAGTPFAADITIGAWYPPNWLYASGNILLTYTVIAVASILIALLLTYWFFLVVELHPYAAALGAIIFVFSAFMMKWSTNEAVFASGMWLPLALGGLEVARRGRVRRGVILAAAGLALSVLGGHAHVALLVWFAAAIWFGTGVVVSTRVRAQGPAYRQRWPRRVVLVAGPAALAVVLAGGLAAVQLLPTTDFAGQIIRQKTTFSIAKATALPIAHLPTFLLPDYHGNPVDGNYEGPGINYTETALYAGLLVFPLGAIGLVRRPGRLAVFFGILIVVGVLAILGTPFYRLILAMPGLSRTYFMTRFVFLLNFGFAGLAAVGLHHLITGAGRRVMVLVLGSSATLLIGILALMLARPATVVAKDYITRHGLRSIAVVLLGTLVLATVVRFPSWSAPAALAVVVAVLLDLWMFGSRFNAFHGVRPVHAATPGTEFLAARPGERPRFVNVGSWLVPPNGELQHRLYGISGYDPFVPRRIVELLSVAEDQLSSARSNLLGPFKASTVGAPVLDLLGVTTVVGPPGEPLPGSLVYDGEFRAWDQPSALPPAWIAGCWEVTPKAEVLPRLSTMTSSELAGTALVVDDKEARRILGGSRTGAACGRGGPARLVRYEPERVVIRATARDRGILVLSDAWFDGWKAKVDGRRASVLRVDHALRGVALSPGSHTVELEYRPGSQVAGQALSLATILVILGTGRGVSRRRR